MCISDKMMRRLNKYFCNLRNLGTKATETSASISEIGASPTTSQALCPIYSSRHLCLLLNHRHCALVGSNVRSVKHILTPSVFLFFFKIWNCRNTCIHFLARICPFVHLTSGMCVRLDFQGTLSMGVVRNASGHKWIETTNHHTGCVWKWLNSTSLSS